MAILRGTRFDIAAFGELIADPSRVAMLLSLLDGSSRPATELAKIAQVAPSTASVHLKRLLEGRLLSVEPRGRHRYFRLAGEDVAHALETLGLLHPVRTSTADPDLSRARTCYRHLAGQLGVAWLRALEHHRLLRIRDGSLVLTQRGVARFTELELSVPKGWPDGKLCLDWTERQNHLGGPLGTLLTEHLFQLDWLARKRQRQVRVTAVGRRELAARFGLPKAVLSE